MSPVEFKKTPCRPVDFKGQGPLLGEGGPPGGKWNRGAEAATLRGAIYLKLS